MTTNHHAVARSRADRGFSVVQVAVAAIAATMVFTTFWHWMAERSATGRGEVHSSFHRITEAMAERLSDVSTTPLTALVVAVLAAIAAGVAVARTWCTPVYGLWITATTTAIAALVVAVQTVIVAPTLLGEPAASSAAALAVVGAGSAVLGVAVWRARIDGPYDQITAADGGQVQS